MISVRTCTACRYEEACIPDHGDLMTKIASDAILQESRLLPHQVSFLLKYIGWSISDLAMYTGITIRAAKDWINGRLLPYEYVELTFRELALCSSLSDPERFDTMNSTMDSFLNNRAALAAQSVDPSRIVFFKHTRDLGWQVTDGPKTHKDHLRSFSS